MSKLIGTTIESPGKVFARSFKKTIDEAEQRIGIQEKRHPAAPSTNNEEVVPPLPLGDSSPNEWKRIYTDRDGDTMTITSTPLEHNTRFTDGQYVVYDDYALTAKLPSGEVVKDRMQIEAILRTLQADGTDLNIDENGRVIEHIHTVNDLPTSAPPLPASAQRSSEAIIRT